MNLAEFLRFVTGLKTSATHLGMDAKLGEVHFEVTEGTLTAIELRGTGRGGYVKLRITVD
jgi:hypothetical protein